MLKMAKKTLSERLVGGMTGMGKKKRGESDHGDHDLAFLELSRCNSYDFEVNTRDSDTVCGFARVERHLVPVEAVQAGMGRFSFLLETCAPGSVPDPLLIASLLDLVGWIFILF